MGKESWEKKPRRREERQNRSRVSPTKKETFLTQVNKDTPVPEMKMWGQGVIGQGGSGRQGHPGSVWSGICRYLLGLFLMDWWSIG